MQLPSHVSGLCIAVLWIFLPNTRKADGYSSDAERAFCAAGEAELDRMMERWERDDAKYGKVTCALNTYYPVSIPLPS